MAVNEQPEDAIRAYLGNNGTMAHFHKGVLRIYRQTKDQPIPHNIIELTPEALSSLIHFQQTMFPDYLSWK